MPAADSGELARRRRLAAAGFITLLILSVFWPSPIVSINQLWMGHDLDIDELSFLGRQAPSWDVVFWGVVGIFFVAMLQSGMWVRRDFTAPVAALRRLRPQLPRRMALLVAGGVFAVATTWAFLDAPLMALAEQWKGDGIEDVIRIVNRFGGGMNPALIVLFFFAGGVVYRYGSWRESALTMALAGGLAGVFAQILKNTVGRARPELWLGPFAFTRDAASSFPSGHTVGAFALAGGLIFTTRSRGLQAAALILAVAVGLSRIFAFRHWPSDVLASALIGLAAAKIFAAGVIRLTNESPEPH